MWHHRVAAVALNRQTSLNSAWVSCYAEILLTSFYLDNDDFNTAFLHANSFPFQATIGSLKSQLEDIKCINLEMYTKLAVSEQK